MLFFSSRRRHTRYWRDWSSDVCSSDLILTKQALSGAPSLSTFARENWGISRLPALFVSTHLHNDREEKRSRVGEGISCWHTGRGHTDTSSAICWEKGKKCSVLKRIPGFALS